MNRKSKTIISLLIVLLSTIYINAQKVNSFALWGSGGYNNFLSGVEKVSTIGGAGVNIGLGYEFQSGGFLMQVGGEFQHYTSNMKMAEFTEIIPMLNTEGKYYDGTFIFDKNQDRQTMGNAAAVLKLGFVTPSNFYMLFGGKYAYNIYGSTKTYTNVTSKGYNDNLIGDDDNGTFSDMPNHGYYTIKRSFNEKLAFQPTIFGSIEAGLQIGKRNYFGVVYRFALFFDFGITALTAKPLLGQSKIIDISQTEEFQPALRPFFYNETTQRIQVIFTGIKFTVLFGKKVEKKYCNCIQNIKWRRTK